jgi:hypothetical protein
MHKGSDGSHTPQLSAGALSHVFLRGDEQHDTTLITHRGLVYRAFSSVLRDKQVDASRRPFQVALDPFLLLEPS